MTTGRLVIDALKHDHDNTIRYLELDTSGWRVNDDNFWVVRPLFRKLDEISGLLKMVPDTARQSRAIWRRLESLSDVAVDLAVQLDSGEQAADLAA